MALFTHESVQLIHETITNPNVRLALTSLSTTIAGMAVWKSITKFFGDGSIKRDVYIGQDQGSVFQAKPIYQAPSSNHIHAVYNAKGTSGTIDYLRDANMSVLTDTAKGMGIDVGRLSQQELVKKIADEVEKKGGKGNW